MENVTKVFVSACFAIGMSAQAQIQTNNLEFTDIKIPYETISAKTDIEDYYIIFFEKDSSASLEYLNENKCVKKNANYYLMNVSTLKLTDDQKNKLLGKFVDLVQTNRSLENAKLHIVFDVDRTKSANLKLISGNHISVTETIEPLCWPVGM